MKEGKLPNGWEWRRLGDCCQIIRGVAFPSNSKIDHFQEGFVACLRTANVQEDVEVHDLWFIPEHFVKNEKQIVEKNDILISSANSLNLVGKVALVKSLDHKTTLGAFISLLRSNSTINPKYLHYYLTSSNFKHFIPFIASTTTNISNISMTKLAKFQMIVPPLPVQREIVAILEQAEATKRLRVESDELTQRFLQSVFKEMFGDPVKNEKGWDMKRLKDVSEVVSGVTKGRKFNGKPTLFVPYLRVANVQDGFLELSEIKNIEVLESDIEKFQLKKGDVILTEGGDRDKLGRGHVWNNEISLCLHQNHIFRVRLAEKILNPEFFSFLISSSYGKAYFAKSAKQTTGIASINSTQLKNFPALFPPLPLQQEFARIVEQVEALRESQRQSAGEINLLFEGLMQKAFTGELVSAVV